MKSAALIVSIVALIATGCIRVEQDLSIKLDGSGTLEIKYYVPDETITRMKSALRLADEMTKADNAPPIPQTHQDFAQIVFNPEEAAIRKKLATYEPLGLTVDKLRVQTRNARREVEISLAFKDLARLAEADFFSAYGFSLTQNSAGAYTLYSRPVTREPLDDQWTMSNTETVKQLSPLMAGFLFKLRITTPTSIIDSNADRSGRFSADWIFDFESDPFAIAKLQRASVQLTFDGTGGTIREFQQPEPLVVTQEPPTEQ